MDFMKNFFSNMWAVLYGLLQALAEIFWKNKWSAFLVYSALFLNIVSWGLFYWLTMKEQPGLIMHYNAFLGIDLFFHVGSGEGGFLDIFFAPIGGLGFFLINVLISVILIFFMRSGDREEERVKAEKREKMDKAECDFHRTYRLGSLLILGGDVIVQVAILIYVVAILIVNLR